MQFDLDVIAIKFYLTDSFEDFFFFQFYLQKENQNVLIWAFPNTSQKREPNAKPAERHVSGLACKGNVISY